MSKQKYINLKHCIASYMFGLNTNKMSFKEIYEWSCHLEKTLSNKKYDVKVLFDKKNVNDLILDKDNLLVVGYNNISLANNKNTNDLKQVINELDKQTYENILFAIAIFKPLKNNNNLEM